MSGEITYIDPKTGGKWVPEFAGQRPPFQPGHEIRRTHGAFIARVTDPIQADLIEEVLADPATVYLTAPRFGPALRYWALAAARVQVLASWVDKMDPDEAMKSDRGQVSPLELLRRWSATEATRAARLGLDPLSAAKLGKDVAQGRQADAAGELTKLRAEHESAQRSTPPPDPTH